MQVLEQIGAFLGRTFAILPQERWPIYEEQVKALPAYTEIAGDNEKKKQSLLLLALCVHSDNARPFAPDLLVTERFSAVPYAEIECETAGIAKADIHRFYLAALGLLAPQPASEEPSQSSDS